ncbi:MAG: hypothetical protein GY715_02005 [Planctomycetes bacterium]|nr:hypothetical protein [Planctomycetota bacterium]
MRVTSIRLRLGLGVIFAIAAVSCASMPQGQTGGGGRSASRLAVENIQSDVMAFADSYTAVVAQSFDRVATAVPEERVVLHDIMVRQVQNAITIAAGPNPAGALLDMTVMVTLQRQVVETYWIPERLGEAGQPILDGLKLLEEEIWAIARRSLDAQQFEALEDLMPVISERYRDQVRVSAIRASDFSDQRRATVARIDGGTSLLQLFQLDPLAGLNPASRELAQIRMLAERTFFWAKRLPMILNWQMQDVILDAFDHPDTQRLIDSVTAMTETSNRLGDIVGELPNQFATEREAAVEQITVAIAAERERPSRSGSTASPRSARRSSACSRPRRRSSAGCSWTCARPSRPARRPARR